MDLDHRGATLRARAGPRVLLLARPVGEHVHHGLRGVVRLRLGQCLDQVRP